VDQTSRSLVHKTTCLDLDFVVVFVGGVSGGINRRWLVRLAVVVICGYVCVHGLLSLCFFLERI